MRGPSKYGKRMDKCQQGEDDVWMKRLRCGRTEWEANRAEARIVAAPFIQRTPGNKARRWSADRIVWVGEGENWQRRGYGDVSAPKQTDSWRQQGIAKTTSNNFMASQTTTTNVPKLGFRYRGTTSTPVSSRGYEEGGREGDGTRGTPATPLFGQRIA